MNEKQQTVWVFNRPMDWRVIEIAKAVGWIFHAGSFNGSTNVERPTGGHTSADAIPFYLTDLDAMHEVEKNLDSLSLRLKYLNTLQEVVDATCGGNAFAAMATASQRAEAFLRTIGKWRDT